MKRICAGIDLGGTNIKYGLCEVDGKSTFFKTVPADVKKGPHHLLDRIRECADELLMKAALSGRAVKHLGIGTPGVVDADTGSVEGMSPNIPGWKGVNPKKHLEPKLRIPVFVDNDVNAVALAESQFGAAKGYGDVIAVAVGTGIGGGILVDGRIYRGGIGGAGEFGHTTIVKDGRKCNCGRKGCLESYASAPNLIRLASKLAAGSKSRTGLAAIFRKQGKLTIKDIFDAFKTQSDKIAISAVEQSADYLACGLSSVLAVLNPEIVVIGGGVADAGGILYVRLVSKLLKERAFEPVGAGTKVAKARLGNKAGFIGAAVLGDHP